MCKFPCFRNDLAVLMPRCNLTNAVQLAATLLAAKKMDEVEDPCLLKYSSISLEVEQMCSTKEVALHLNGEGRVVLHILWLQEFRNESWHGEQRSARKFVEIVQHQISAHKCVSRQRGLRCTVKCTAVGGHT